MAIKLKPLKDQVIVITGASSGIGLATARAAAAKGAKVVLVSRNEEVLNQVVQEMKAAGREAIYVRADVGIKEQVQWIADTAMYHFGRIDTWVNDAGVSIYGRLEEVSEEDSRRLFDTNFWGVVNGSLAAVRCMKHTGGAIINVGSEVSDIVVPLQGMYSASKHAVKGFTDALRIELEEEKAPISVTLIKPAGIDSPYPQHARNYTDRELTLPAPVYAPEEVAYAILQAATHPYRDIMVGGGAKLMSALNKRVPGVMDWISARFMSSQQVKKQPAQHKQGALYQAGEDGQVRGNHEGYVMKKSLYTRARLHPAVTATLVVAAGAVAFTLTNQNSRNK